MATYNAIVDVTLTPEGHVASETVTSHTQGTKISEGSTYTAPAPTSSNSTIYVDKAADTKTVTNFK